jgi:hypothetical protein
MSQSSLRELAKRVSQRDSDASSSESEESVQEEKVDTKIKVFFDTGNEILSIVLSHLSPSLIDQRKRKNETTRIWSTSYAPISTPNPSIQYEALRSRECVVPGPGDPGTRITYNPKDEFDPIPPYDYAMPHNDFLPGYDDFLVFHQEPTRRGEREAQYREAVRDLWNRAVCSGDANRAMKVLRTLARVDAVTSDDIETLLSLVNKYSPSDEARRQSTKRIFEAIDGIRWLHQRRRNEGKGKPSASGKKKNTRGGSSSSSSQDTSHRGEGGDDDGRDDNASNSSEMSTDSSEEDESEAQGSFSAGASGASEKLQVGSRVAVSSEHFTDEHSKSLSNLLRLECQVEESADGFGNVLVRWLDTGFPAAIPQTLLEQGTLLSSDDRKNDNGSGKSSYAQLDLLVRFGLLKVEYQCREGEGRREAKALADMLRLHGDIEVLKPAEANRINVYETTIATAEIFEYWKIQRTAPSRHPSCMKVLLSTSLFVYSCPSEKNKLTLSISSSISYL